MLRLLRQLISEEVTKQNVMLEWADILVVEGQRGITEDIFSQNLDYSHQI